MKTQTQKIFTKSTLCLALSSAMALPTISFAEEVKIKGLEVIEVTASRRTTTVQETPVNITALYGDGMKDQGISSPEDVARWVPGLTMSDQGGREAGAIIVRGLNTNSSGRGTDSDGGTVATYFGEIPLRIDFRLTDIDRVEVLIGPQGTLYGAGSLGGAIRYILNKPELDMVEGSISGDVFSLSESSGTGSELGFVFNTPIIEDELAVRVNFNYYNSPGFIDYNYIIKEPGVSEADPDWNDSEDVAANLTKIADANDETITTGRLSARWSPNDWFDGTLNYFYQKQENGGNSITQYNTLSSTNSLSPFVGQYDSTRRYEEKNKKEDTLLSLELEFDLGFAKLVSASGASHHKQDGIRDQTDLLMDIYTGYADFPAFTNDTDDSDTFTQELRLVSQSDSALNWIVGYYYNKFELSDTDKEFAPGLTDGWFDGEYTNIEFDMEFIQRNETKNTEQAIFGEVSYDLTDKFTLTVGARFYEYDLRTLTDNHAPFYDGPIASEDDLDFTEVTANANGNLFKFNAGYQFSDDVMTYFTVSEGFRLGGANGVPLCDGTTQVCGLSSELDYKPDTTTNYELGFKSTWFNNKLHMNAAIFNIDWEDAQIAATTINGGVAIISNAGLANSKGIELSTRAMLSDSITTYATYSYAKAELTENADALFGQIGTSGTDLQDYYDGEKGDRLPGAPEHQLSFGLSYETEVLNDKLLAINYGITVQSDVYTKVGLKADGEILPGYALSNLSAKLSDEAWSITLYADNLFDKYANTGVRRDKAWAGEAMFESQNRALPELQRTYGHYITRPRTVGLRFNYNF
ncbi:MAG: iron complex outermembrane receptor protein [Paraglaciecola sp.]|jgi:iron complex outermembrane receptor protein